MIRPMAHWDEERDRRWVKMMRETSFAREPYCKRLIDKFEETGDLIYIHAFCQVILKGLPKKASKS